MKLLIAGSRTFDPSIPFIDATVKRLVEGRIELLLCGGAFGVDKAAREWALGLKIHVEMHWPDYMTHGPKRAPIIRNEEMVKLADYVILVWDGLSRGTESVIRFCHKYRKPYTVHFV